MTIPHMLHYAAWQRCDYAITHFVLNLPLCSFYIFFTKCIYWLVHGYMYSHRVENKSQHRNKQCGNDSFNATQQKCTYNVNMIHSQSLSTLPLFTFYCTPSNTRQWVNDCGVSASNCHTDSHTYLHTNYICISFYRPSRIYTLVPIYLRSG